jgi:hypothetical protein
MLSVSIIKAGGDVVVSEEVPDLCLVLGLKRTLASKLNIHPIDQHLCTEAICGWKANCGSREVPEYRFGAEENVGVKVEHIPSISIWCTEAICCWKVNCGPKRPASGGLQGRKCEGDSESGREDEGGGGRGTGRSFGEQRRCSRSSCQTRDRIGRVLYIAAHPRRSNAIENLRR